MGERLFTSESVSSGHPDKLCDQISDAILDACISIDPFARVAVETLVKGMDNKSLIVLGGEVTVKGEVPDYEKIARDTCAKVGYNSHEIGMDATSEELCEVRVAITTQSPDISDGVNVGGAGDQGMMFGYACTESESFPGLIGTYMPLPSILSQQLTRRLTEVREKNILPWVRPDGKSQVTIEYDAKGNPLRASTVVLANQHKDLTEETGSIDLERKYIHDELEKHVIEYVIPKQLLDSETKIIVNGTGRFVDPGGPYADAGLTGRKIIVDTYGGSAPHGGGAFSGKDPTKVDRSAAYMSRWVAKHVVASGLADKCTIQVAYAIGREEPVSINIDTHSTGIISDVDIESRISKVFDFSPKKIIENLELRNPIYFVSASGGHFGRDPTGLGHFSWERIIPEKMEMLRKE
ncbi:MAG TPA: methionine adenosyltransferase [Candidatus Poseidoniaceae archaeon]|nr:methionine adenosyltransferase [Candidatus Poseidoniaceae archaeon]